MATSNTTPTSYELSHAEGKGTSFPMISFEILGLMLIHLNWLLCPMLEAVVATHLVSSGTEGGGRVLVLTPLKPQALRIEEERLSKTKR